MKASRKNESGFTRTELIVVIIIIFVLLSLLVPVNISFHANADRIVCVNNLKQLGVAYSKWANDHGGRFPWQTPAANGGSGEILLTARVGSLCWTSYRGISNDFGLGVDAKVLTCPSDERKPAESFAQITNNLHLSYFIGIQAGDTFPQGILGGDRNLGPGTVPDPGYGYSPANGAGNDVTITGPVCWSLKMHTHGNPTGAGNIILGDGSAQQVTSAGFNRNWLTNAMAPMPDKSLGLRLLFP